MSGGSPLPMIARVVRDGRRGKAGSGQAAALRWSGRRCAPTALRCSVSWPVAKLTALTSFAAFKQAATSQFTKRAARAATSPALLGAPQARCDLPEPRFADRSAVFATNTTAGGLRGRCCAGRAISVATSSAGPGSARAQRVLRELTRRRCLSAVSIANEASFATRPRTEQRSAVDAKRRPPSHEPAPRSACRDALNVRTQSGLSRIAGLGREQSIAAPQCCARSESCEARRSN